MSTLQHYNNIKQIFLYSVYEPCCSETYQLHNIITILNKYCSILLMNLAVQKHVNSTTLKQYQANIALFCSFTLLLRDISTPQHYNNIKQILLYSVHEPYCSESYKLYNIITKSNKYCFILFMNLAVQRHVCQLYNILTILNKYCSILFMNLIVQGHVNSTTLKQY